jgi:hypothetical protein
VAGSYIPKLLSGPPSDEGKYMLWQNGKLSVFHPAKLSPKPGRELISIKLKRFLFTSWLELEGARSIVSVPAEEVTVV